MIAIDTHVWLWKLAAPDRLSPLARTAIETADRLMLSVASCLEVVTLVRRGRLALDRDVETWIRQGASAREIEIAPVSIDVAIRAGALPDPFSGDPADRLIYATAVTHALPLVTRDRRIRAFDPARTIW